MKRVLNVYTNWAILLSALLFTGCNDWLDVKPQARVEADDLFTSEKGFKDALIACYIKMGGSNLYGQNLTMTFAEYLAQHWDFTQGNGRDAALVKNFDYKASSVESTIKNIYGDLFNVIVQANIVLENIKNNGDVFENKDLCNLVEAEALTIRAFCHTDILRLFGQLPNNPTTTVKLPYATEVTTGIIPYYPYNDYINLILEDIKKAQDLFRVSDPIMKYTFGALNTFTENNSQVNLEDVFMGYRRVRFNYWASEALKARLYMYIGDKENAWTTAKNVIDAKTESGDAVLGLSGQKDFESSYFACPTECLMALSIKDLRTTSMNLFYDNGHFTTAAHYNEIFTGQSTDLNNRTNFWKKTTDSQGKEFYDFQKYDQPEKIEGFTTNLQIVPLLRLSEMYLIAIESAPSLEDANALYKTYMEARGVIADSKNQEQLREEIEREYRREFFGEGQMFYFYKRLGMKKMLWKSDRELVETDYIVPLPSTELNIK